MNQDVKKRRKILNKLLIILISVFLLLLVVAGVFYGIDRFLKKENMPSGGIYYYPAKYDENIFDNKAYVGYDRDLLYCDGSVTQLYVFPDNFESAPLECQFFLSYFDTVINGRYNEIASYYVDGYFDTDPMFTMQMIYEPYVKFHSVSSETIDGEEVDVLNFQVRYKIFKNNGTFRTGIESNTAVPQIYQLIKNGDSYQIARILEIEYED